MGEAHVRMEAEIGVILPEVKKYQDHQKMEEAGKGLTLEPLEGMWLLASITMRTSISAF